MSEIVIDSVFELGKSYNPQKFLKKKIKSFIKDDLESADDESRLL